MKENSRAPGPVNAAVPGLLLSLAAFICLYLAFSTDISQAVYIKFLFRKIYIPVIGWACLLGYVFLWSRLSREKFLDAAGKGIVLGLSFHGSVLLYKLNAQLSAGSPLSPIYLYYIKSVTIVGLAALFPAAFYAVRAAFSDRGIGPFFMPIVFLLACLSFMYVRLGGVIFPVAAALGAFFSYVAFFQRPAVSLIFEKIRWLLSDTKRTALILFILGFSIRLAFSFQILHQTGGGRVFVDASDDGRSYDSMAWTIARDPSRIFTGHEVFPSRYDPGYILFLGLIYRIFGHNFYAVTIIQSVINGLLPVAVYYIASMLFSGKIGLLSAVIVSLDQAAIMHSIVLGTEALFNTVLVLVLLYLLRHAGEPSGRRCVYIAGIFFGMAVITRYMLFMLPLFMLIAAFFMEGRRMREKIFDAVLIYAVAFIFILPITFINYSNTRQFHLVEESGDRFATVWYTELKGWEEISPGNTGFVEIGFDPLKRPLDSFLLIFRKPVDFMMVGGRIWAKRCANFFCWPNFGFFDPLILVNPSRFANEFGSTAEFYFFIAFMVGSFAAVAHLRKERGVAMIFAVISYFVFVHVLLFRVNTVRYKVAVIPYLAIIFSLGVYRLYAFAVKSLVTTGKTVECRQK